MFKQAVDTSAKEVHMRRILIASVSLLAVGILAVVGIMLLGPDGAVAQEQSDDEAAIAFHFSPLDEVLDELVDEDVIDTDQANAIRERMSERMPIFGDGFHFGMERFTDGLPEGLTPPPGPPGTDEFDAWLEEMRGLMGDDFFGGHMFRFDGDLPEDGFFPFGGGGHRGPGMMGDGFREFHGFDGIDDLEGFIDEMTERFGTELPEHMQDMIDHLTDELSEVDGASTSLDA
jgi:hypothetical protein